MNLLPCPFCGSPAALHTGQYKSCHVGCTGCWAGTELHMDANAAAEKWNKRTVSQEFICTKCGLRQDPPKQEPGF